MGFITLSNGEVVHTLYLNPNPVVKVENKKIEIKNNVTIHTMELVHQNGNRQVVILTCTT